MGITALLLSSIGVVGILVLIFLKIIWWLEMLGYIKALITVIKYTPQVNIYIYLFICFFIISMHVDFIYIYIYVIFN